MLNSALEELPKYTGQTDDIETDLYYYGSRYYDPVLGRFIQPDSIIADVYSSQALNPYAYVLGNPLRYVDPAGYAPVSREYAEEQGTTPEAYFNGDNGVNDISGDAESGTAAAMASLASYAAVDFATGWNAAVIYDISHKAASAVASFLDAINIAKGIDLHPGAEQMMGFAGMTGGVLAVDAAIEQSLVRYFPGNSGFIGATKGKFLMPGEMIDRYGGGGSSRFFSTSGTPKEMRSLPPGVGDEPIRSFEVMKPFEVRSGQTAPAFGEIGLGTQYEVPVKLEILLRRGVVREVK